MSGVYTIARSCLVQIFKSNGTHKMWITKMRDDKEDVCVELSVSELEQVAALINQYLEDNDAEDEPS